MKKYYCVYGPKNEIWKEAEHGTDDDAKKYVEKMKELIAGNKDFDDKACFIIYGEMKKID